MKFSEVIGQQDVNFRTGRVWNIAKMGKYAHVFIIVIPTVLIKKVLLKRIMNI